MRAEVLDGGQRERLGKTGEEEEAVMATNRLSSAP